MAADIDLTERLTYFGLPSSSKSLRDLYSFGARGTSTSTNHVSPAYGNDKYEVVSFDTTSGAHPDISLRDFDSAPSLYGKSYTPYVNDGNASASADMRITTAVKAGVDVNGNNRQGDGRIFGYSQNTTFYANGAIGSIANNRLPGGRTMYELLIIPVYKSGVLSAQYEFRLRIVGSVSNSDTGAFKNLFISALQFPRINAVFDGYSVINGVGTTQWRWFSNNSGTGWHNPFRLPGGNLYSPAYPCWSTTK